MNVAIKRACAIAAAMVGMSGMAQAQSGGFGCVTGNSVGSCAQAEAALSWTWDGSIFTIANAAGGGYVSEVYFDLVVPGMSVSWLGGVGTSFSAGAAPDALPGGNMIGFVSDFAFDSDPGRGAPIGGIDPGESTRFAITGASAGSFDIGQISAGVHVRRLINEQSEGLVTSVSPVPEPSTYGLMLAGLGAVGWVTRRRRRSESAAD